jgi:uncharacterized RDD family membrane protein YckC
VAPAYPTANYPTAGAGDAAFDSAGRPLAPWAKRAVGGAIDYGAPMALSWFVTLATNSAIVDLFMSLAIFGWFIYNTVYLGGTTGRTWGRVVAGTRLVRESGGQPVGPGLAFLRHILHCLDSIFFIGFLFPLWDPKRQTFADKILGTVVIEDRAPGGRPTL